MQINKYASGYNAAGFFFGCVRKSLPLRTHNYKAKMSVPNVRKGAETSLRMFANLVDLCKHL